MWRCRGRQISRFAWACAPAFGPWMDGGVGIIPSFPIVQKTWLNTGLTVRGTEVHRLAEHGPRCGIKGLLFNGLRCYKLVPSDCALE
jgi:hypothetical protein